MRRRSKFLLSILTVICLLWILAFLSLPIQLSLPLSEVQKRGAATVYPLFLSILAVPVALSYLLARKGRYSTAARILVATSSAVSFAEILVTGDPRLGDLPIVAVALCSILLSPKDTIACFLITIIGFVLVPFANPLVTFSHMIGALIVTTAVGSVSLVAAVIHRRDLEQIEAQAKEISKNQERLLDTRKMEAVARLSSGVAHEFNNILMAISGYAEVITRKAVGVIADYAGHILEASGRAGRLTEGMLSFSQQQMLKPTVVDVDDLMKHHERKLRSSLRPETTLALRASPERKILSIDTDLFCEALRILARKSAEHAPDRAVVTIRTGTVELPPGNELHLSAGPYCSITIGNDGPMTIEGTESRVFEPFFTRGELGTGDLDLAAAYGIIRQSGGRVEAKRGMAFVVIVPRMDSPG